MYPSGIDTFTEKKDHILDTNGNIIQEGDDVLAEHINSLQNSIVAIETVLGTSPMGIYPNVADRLNDISKIGLLRIPSICMYYGEWPSLAEAIDQYARYDYVILPPGADGVNIARECNASVIGLVNVSSDIDAVKAEIYGWYQQGLDGVLLDPFDYTYITRHDQNSLLSYAHGLGLFCVISGNDLDIFPNSYVEGKNTNYTPIALNNDIYLIKDFAYNEPIDELYARMDRYAAWRDTFHVKLFATSIVPDQGAFNYVNAAGMLFKIDGLNVCKSYYDSLKYNEIPLVGIYKSDTPILHTNGRYYRSAPCGTIWLEQGRHGIDGPKIPNDFIDNAALIITSDNVVELDVSKLVGDIPAVRMQKYVIDAINITTSPALIEDAHIGEISAEKVQNALVDLLASQDTIYINQLASNMLHVLNDAQVDGTLSATRIKASVISAINGYFDDLTIYGTLETERANIGTLAANLIGAINIKANHADFDTAIIDSAIISELSADKMRANVINAINGYFEALDVGTLEAERANIDMLAANLIHALNIKAGHAEFDSAVIDSAIIGELSAQHIQAEVIEAIRIAVGDIVGDTAAFETLVADVISSQLINANNIRITSAAGGPTDALLTIDQGGMLIQSKQPIDSTTKLMKLTKDGLFISNDGGNIWSLKLTGDRLYVDSVDIEDAAITNAHISNVSADKLIAGTIDASKSIKFTSKAGAADGNSLVIDDNGLVISDNPVVPSKLVKLDKNGISISNDGVTWSTKIDGNGLKISSADIGQINAGNINISSGDVLIDGTGIIVDGATGNGISIVTPAQTITLNKDGLISTNFKISADGNVEVIGKIISNSGYFGTLTDGVAVGTNGLSIIGNGLIQNSNIILTSSQLKTVDNTVTLGSGGLYIGAGSINIGSRFLVNSAGDMTATNAMLSGRVEAAEGYFGNSTNHISITTSGLELSGGAIYTTDNKLILSSDGILAQKGTIGQFTLTDTGLTSSVIDILGTGVTVKGTDGIVLTSGTVAIKNGASTYMTMGKLSASNYGLQLDVSDMHAALDLSGLSLWKHTATGDTYLLQTDTANGNLMVRGTINATGGSFAGVTVTGDLHVTTGTIYAGDATLSTNGLNINGTSSSITLGGGNFSVTGEGIITANSGTIGGLAVTPSGMQTGNIVIGGGSINIGTDITLGSFDSTYGLKVAGTKPITITPIGIQSANFTVDTDGNVSLKGAVTATSGSFTGVINASGGTFTGDVNITTGSLIAGSAILNSDGLIMNQGTITLDHFKVAADGAVTATAGTIGGVTINDTKITAGNAELRSDGIFITDGTNDIVSLGQYETNKYGIRIQSGYTTTKIDADGISSEYTLPGGTTTQIFKIDSNGNLSVTGSIVATTGTFHGRVEAESGYFNNVDVTGNVAVTSGTITAGNTSMSNTGITIGSGAQINLNNKFIANDNGIQAIAGSIGGWKLTSTELYAGTDPNTATININSQTEQIKISDVILGKYDDANYGLKLGSTIVFNSIDGLIANNGQTTTLWVKPNGDIYVAGEINSYTGAIGGWEINMESLAKNGIMLDSNGAIRIGNNNEILLSSANGINVNNRFTVDLNGNMTATAADVTGAINATSGAFTGNVNITTGKLIAGDGIGSYVALDNTGLYIEHKDGETITKDAAITANGIYGRLLTDNSVIWDSFDKTPPVAPTLRGVSTHTDVTANGEIVSVDVKWTAPTTNVGGSPLMDLGGYIIYQSNDNISFYPIATIDADANGPKISNDDNAVIITNTEDGKEFDILSNPSYTINFGLKPNTEYWFKIAAYDKQGNKSSTTPTFAVTTTADSTAPNQPLPPTTVPGLKSILVELHHGSEQFPELAHNDYDIDHYIVERISGINTTSFTIKDKRFLDGALYTVTNDIYTGDGEIDYTRTYIYRCKAVDTSGNQSDWSGWSTEVTPSQVGKGDLVADSVTAMQLNIGAMVKSINTKETTLFHFDGTLQSTQGLVPYTEEVNHQIITHQSGFFKKEAKFGASLAIEEDTVNLVYEATNNANFAHDTNGWAIGSGVFHAVNGADGVQDGYIDVYNDDTNYCIVNLTPGTYTISAYAKGYNTNLIVKVNDQVVINSPVTSIWDRYTATFTIDTNQATIYLKSNTHVAVDNIQLEAREYATSFINGSKQEGYVDYYGPAVINLTQGVISFWIKSIIGWNNTINNDHSVDPYIDYWFCYGNPNEANSLWAKYDREHAQLTVHYNNDLTCTFNAMDDWVHFAFVWQDGSQILYINGEPVAVGNASAITSVTDDKFRLGYWPRITDRIIEEYEDDGERRSRASALIDELRIDNVTRDANEILSWYKQSSSFYDAAAQIDADSQNITAANASVVINNEGIKITDGKLEVVSSDGQTLITGGRLKVDGLDIGVPQSNNYVQNSYFSMGGTVYGYGDAHIEGVDTIINGAKEWMHYRSSGPTLMPTLISMIYNPLKDAYGDPVVLHINGKEIALNILNYNTAEGIPVTTPVWEYLSNLLGLGPSVTTIDGIIGYVDMSSNIPIPMHVLYFDDTTMQAVPMQPGNTVVEYRIRSGLYGEPSYVRLGVTGTNTESVMLRQDVSDLILQTGENFKPHAFSCKFHYEDGANGKVVADNSDIRIILDEVVSNPVSVIQTPEGNPHVIFEQYYWPIAGNAQNAFDLIDPDGYSRPEMLMTATRQPAIGNGVDKTFYIQYGNIESIVDVCAVTTTTYHYSASEYTADLVNGTITFNTPPANGAKLTVSYRLQPIDWTIKNEVISPFQDDDPNSYNGSYSYTNRVGHALTYSVDLESVSDADIFMIMGPEIGISHVLIDGKDAGVGDLSWPIRRRSVYNYQDFRAGHHTITLINTGLPGRFTNTQLLESMGQVYYVLENGEIVKRYRSSVAMNMMNYDDWVIPTADNPNLNPEANTDQIDFSQFVHTVTIDAEETKDRWLPVSITPTYANSTDASGKPIFKPNTKVSYRFKIVVSKDVSTRTYFQVNHSPYVETDIMQSSMPLVTHNITPSASVTTLYTYSNSILDGGMLQMMYFPGITSTTPTIFNYVNDTLVPNTTLTRVGYQIVNNQPVPQFTGANQYCVISGGHNMPGAYVFSPGTTASNIVFSYDMILPDTTTIYFTEVQGELGKNMSYGRMPLGLQTIPASWLELYNSNIPRFTGVQWSQLTQYDEATEILYPYAMTGIRTFNLADGVITNQKLAYGSVTDDKIAQYAISKDRLRYLTKIRPNDAAYGEILFAADLNGVNKTGHLYVYVESERDIEIYRNGMLLDIGDDYTVTLADTEVTIEFTEPLRADDKIIINAWEGIPN